MSASDFHLTTRRLNLAPITDADVASLVRHWGDEQVRRYLWEDTPVTLDMVNAVVTTSNLDFERASYGAWAVRRKEESALIGMCGLRQVQGTEWTEILFSIRRRFWGQGVAREAARGVLEYAFDVLQLSRVVASFDADNVASARVLRCLGMTEFARLNRRSALYWAVTREQLRHSDELAPVAMNSTA